MLKEKLLPHRDLIEKKILHSERINNEDAYYLYTEASLEDLQRWATHVKARYHNPKKTTYLTMGIINYTNICVAQCDYCAFYRLPNSPEGYLLSQKQIFDRIQNLIDHGATLIGFNGGFHPKLHIGWYSDLFVNIRKKFGDKIEFYAMTIAEMMYAARQSKMSYYEACLDLKKNGVRWITGGGSEILTNDFRKRHSAHKFSADEYMFAQEEVIRAGLKTTGTMVIGFDETIDERIEHLYRTRALQDKTNSLFSFLSWTYKPDNTELGGQEISNEEYLRHLAVARIYLDNISFIRTSVLTQNENALRGLHFGANDFDLPLEDEVTEKAGAKIERNIQKVLDFAKQEGFELEYRAVT